MKENPFNDKFKKIEKRLEELEWDKKPHLDRCRYFQYACSGTAILSIQPYEEDGYYIQGEAQYPGIFKISHCPFCGEILNPPKQPLDQKA